MTELDVTIDTYLEAYGEPDADRRSDLIGRVWSADGRLIDPPLDGAGHAGINEMAEALQVQFPGATFRRTSEIDRHPRIRPVRVGDARRRRDAGSDRARHS